MDGGLERRISHVAMAPIGTLTWHGKREELPTDLAAPVGLTVCSTDHVSMAESQLLARIRSGFFHSRWAARLTDRYHPATGKDPVVG